MRGIFYANVLFSIFILNSVAHALTPAVGAYNNFFNFNVTLNISAYYEGEVLTGYCNGSIIDNRHIVTAAHCFVGAMKLLDQSYVQLNEYRTKNLQNGKQFRGFYTVQKLAIRSVQVLPIAELTVWSGQGRLNSAEDIALVELKEPLDLQALQIRPIEVISPSEYVAIQKNPDNYPFAAVTTNFISHSNNLDTRRIASFYNMIVDNGFNKIFGNFIWTFNTSTLVDEMDSGGPLLVHINGSYKFIGVIKGVLAAIAYKANAFAPVVPNWCALTRNSTAPRPYCP